MFDKLSTREKKLALAVVGLGGAFVLFMVWSYFYNTYREQRQDFNRLTMRQSELELNAERAKLASARRLNYRDLSLHPDPEVAKTQYNAWLLKTAAEFGLGTPTVTKQGPVEKKFQQKVVGHETRFTMTAEGNIKDLTRFLYHFHTTNILHRITDLNILPARANRRNTADETVDNNKLILNFTIEMLSLPDANISKEITTKPELLTLAGLEDYTKVILPRNMFGFPNNPPEFVTGETQKAETDEKISFDLRAKDPDDDTDLVYEMLESDIEDAALTPSSGKARFTAPAQEEGEYHFKFRVTDSHPDQKSSEIEMVLVVKEPPPKPVKKEDPPPPPFDPSSRTFITGIVRNLEGVDQVWISIKPTGERLELTVGDEFKVGPHEGRVVEFTDGGVVVEVDNEAVFFKTRDNFEEPRALPPGYLVD